MFYVWKHNAFPQNVILKENIAEFPATLNRATTRLEVVSELVESPEVTINQQILKQEGQPDLVDDGLHRCTEQRRNGWCGRNCSSGR